MEQPTLVYTAYTIHNRAIIVSRWRTIFAAREGTKKAIAAYHDAKIWCKVWQSFEHERSGEFEVWLMFGPNTDADKMIDVINGKNKTPLL